MGTLLLTGLCIVGGLVWWWRFMQSVEMTVVPDANTLKEAEQREEREQNAGSRVIAGSVRRVTADDMRRAEFWHNIERSRAQLSR